MKLILDFDDVIFNVGELKEKFFSVLEVKGFNNAREEYHLERKSDQPFSLKLFLIRVCKVKDVPSDEIDAMYEEIMSGIEHFKNEYLFQIIEEIGKENCYIVTSGDKEFQMDKITRVGVNNLVQEVFVVPNSKKEIMEELCTRFANEKVIFIDNKNKHTEEIDTNKFPNLKAILYNKIGLNTLKAELTKN